MTELLERMDAFFDSRLAGYDRHQRTEIAGAEAFYPLTASLLPREKGARVLDLGCGTGLELEDYFRLNPQARVTGIDLAPGMLAALRAKFPGQALTLRCQSYFACPLGEGLYDAAVSVESLHHFSAVQKFPLYRRVRAALKEGGTFVLTDYFADTEEEEARNFVELARLRAAQGLDDKAFYHYDTPLTAAREARVLRAAGFARVEERGRWGRTHTLVCAAR